MGAIGVLAAAALLGFNDFVSGYIGAAVMELLVLLLFASLLTTIVNAWIQGNNLVHVSAVLSTIGRTTRVVFQVGLVLLGFSLVGMLWG